MDYCAVEDCYSFVELSIMQPEAISRALKARTEGWANLLDGEDRRWKSIEELRSVCRRTLPATQPIAGSSERYIRAEWTDATAVYDYVFHVRQHQEA